MKPKRKGKSLYRAMSVVVTMAMVLSLVPSEGITQARAELIKATQEVETSPGQADATSTVDDETKEAPPSSEPPDSVQPENAANESQPAAEQPAADKPAAEQPAAEQPQETVEPAQPDSSSNLRDFVTQAQIEGADEQDGVYKVREGTAYNVRIAFAERADKRFAEEGELTYELPSGFVPAEQPAISNPITVTYHDEQGGEQTVAIAPHAWRVEGSTLHLTWNMSGGEEARARLLSASDARFELVVSGSFAARTESVDFGTGAMAVQVVTAQEQKSDEQKSEAENANSESKENADKESSEDTSASDDKKQPTSASDSQDTAKNTKTDYAYEDDQVRVTAKLSSADALPAQAELHVVPISEGTPGYDYDAYLSALNESSDKIHTQSNTLLYDVSFLVDDSEVEPENATVSVGFEFKRSQLKDGLAAEQAGEVEVTHLPEIDGKPTAKTLDANVNIQEEKVSFTTTSFSVYGLSNPQDGEQDIALTTQEETWQESDRLENFLINAVVSGVSTNADGAYVVEKDVEYGIALTFKEGRRYQFKNDATLTYSLPTSLTVPETQTKEIEISVVSGGVTYKVPATLEVNQNGTLTITFDQTSENYPRLANANNASLRAEFTASFGDKATFTGAEGSVIREVAIDTEDHGEAYVEKKGSYDDKTGTFTYTIYVTSSGKTTNVNVKDVLVGDALRFNNDVQVSGNSSSYTDKYASNGFDYTFASMEDGETITITYTSSVDFSKGSGGKVTYDQTKNTVTSTYNDKPHSSEYGQEVYYWNISKESAGSTKNGSVVTATWTATENPLALISMAGSTFTDSFNKGNAKSMQYSGVGPTIEVYDQSGKLVETRNPTWAQVGVSDTSTATSFTYNYPSTDKNYKYVYTYTTDIETAGATSDVVVTNDATGKYWKDSAGITIPNNDKVTISKQVDKVTSKEVTWKSVIRVPYNDGNGLTTAVVTDKVPATWLSSEYARDLYKEGSIQVEGLLDGEAYTVDSSNPDKVVITFTKDGAPGLKGVDGGHEITVTLTTTNNQDWIDESGATTWLQEHTNTIDINGTTATAKAVIGPSSIDKSDATLVQADLDGDGVGETNCLRYELILKNVYDDAVEINDMFDTSLLTLVPPTDKLADNLKIYGGNQYYQGDGPNAVSYSSTATGAKFTCNNLVKDSSNVAYSYQKIVYYLKLKDGVDLVDLAAQAGGTYTVTNTASWDGHEDTSNYTTTYDPLSKEITRWADNDYRYAHFRITYNPKKATLNGGSNITLTDVMNEHLSIDHSSVKVYLNDSTTPDTELVSYSFSGERKDGVATGGTVGTYIVPDETKVVIEYRAMVIGSGGFTYKNTVTDSTSKKSASAWVNMDASGGGSASQLSIKVSKVDGYNAAKKLAGVKFLLYSATGMSLYGSDSPHAGEKSAYVTTDENGILDISYEKYGFSLIEGEKYFLEEVTPPSGYQRVGFPYQFTLTEDMTKVNWDTYTYFNGETFQIKNWPLEGLVVEKVVDSQEEDKTADQNKEFTYEVSILDADGNLDTSVNTTYGDMTFANGVATFKLKHNQQMGAYDMPANTKFKVVEKDSQGFVVYTREGTTAEYAKSEDGSFTGETKGGGEYTLVSFKNADERGALGLKKSVTVNGTAAAETDAFGTKNKADGDYTFVVKNSEGATKATVVATVAQGVMASATVDGENATITDGYVVVPNLRPGTYTITEQSPTNGTTLVGSNNKTVTVVAGTDGTYVDDGAKTEFTNNKVETGEITLSKELVTHSPTLDANVAFLFTVKLSDTTINGTYEGMKFVNGVADVSLRGGQSVKASGLPTGITYTISEAKSDPDNFTCTGVTGASETNDASKRKAAGTITTTAASVTFTNTRKEGALTVQKTVSSDYTPDNSKKFQFTVTIKDSTLTGTYGDMTFTNGVATFELAHGASLTATGLPKGIAYTVAETTDSGFTTTWSGTTTKDETTTDKTDAPSGKIAENTTDTITATNTRKTGELKVTKKVASNSYNNEEFNFKATFYTDARRSQQATGLQGTFTRTDVSAATEFTNGTATFTLKKDQVASFSNLPYGLYYTVTETDANTDGWTLQGDTSHMGSITTTTASETFTNSKTTGGLTLTKKVSSPVKQDKEERKFTYEVVLSDTNFNQTVNGVQFTNGTGTVTLKNNETWTLEGVDEDTTFTITETLPQGAEYDVTNKVNSTTTTGAVAKGKITEASTSVIYTNTRKTGGLEVSKKVVSDAGADANQEFTFTVTLGDTEGDEGRSINGTFGDLIFTEGVATVNLKANEKATATGLPDRIPYTVTEASVEGFELTGITKNNESESIDENKPLVSGKVPTSNTDAVEFTNTRLTSQFSIAKVLDSDLAADADKEFTFNIVLSDKSITNSYELITTEGEYQTVEFEKKKDDDPTSGVIVKTEGGTTSTSTIAFTNGEATVSLKGKQVKTIKGLPTGITYTITEASNPGFQLVTSSKTGTHNDDGPVPFSRREKDIQDEKLNVHTVTYPDTWTYNNAREVGDLKVSKSIVSDASLDAAKTFTFTVKLSDTSINKTYTAVDQDGNKSDVTFTNGVATITVTTADYAGFKTIQGLPTSVGYTVTEASATGFTLQGNTSETGTISTTLSEAEFTNKRNTGNLSLTKKLVSQATADASKEFTFTVTLYKDANKTTVEPLNKTYGTMTFVNGVATVKLKGGAMATAKDLPTDLYYTITEATQDGLTLTGKTNETGQVVEGTTATASTFTNTRQTGGFTVSKHVISTTASDKEKDFTFTVTLTGAPVTGKYGDMTFTNGVATFTLKDGQHKTTSGLPTDVAYKVVENTESGFVAWDGTTDEAERLSTDAATGKAYIAGKVSTTSADAAFYNRRDEGDLKVTKRVSSNYTPDESAEYSFTVALGTALTGKYGDMTFKNGTASFKLTKDQSIEAIGLPADTTYTVTETTPEGMVTTWEGKASGTIVKDETASVTATNTRDNASLEVNKTVVSHTSEDTSMEFSFTLGFYTDAAFTIPAQAVTGTYTITKKDGSTKESQDFTGDKTIGFSLADGEKLSIADLPLGIYYKVEEASDNGFATTQTGESGKLAKTNVAKFTNTRSEGGLFVSKTVKSDVPADKTLDFGFVVTLYNDSKLTQQATSINGTYDGDDDPTTNADGAMTFKNGKAAFTLKNGELAFAYNLPKGLYYKVVEDTPANFNVSTGEVSDNPGVSTGQIIAGSTENVDYVNTRKNGNLEVKKELLNADLSPSTDTTKEFNVVVELADTTINGTFGDITFTNGRAVFTIKNGEIKSTANKDYESDEDGYYTLPAGLRYTVTETHANGYVTTWDCTTGKTTHSLSCDQTWETSDTDNPMYSPTEETGIISANGEDVRFSHELTYNEDGTLNSWTKGDASTNLLSNVVISENTTDNVTFKNAPEVAPLTVYKELESDLSADGQKEFQFRVTLEDKSIAGEYGDMTFEAGVAEFKLKGGESKTAVNLPKGVRYSVTEVSEDEFVSSDSNTSGVIGFGSDGQEELPYTSPMTHITYKVVAEDGTASDLENAPADIRSKAGYTNTRHVGKLSVKKTVDSNTASDKAKDKTFHFKVTLYSDADLTKVATDVNGYYPAAYLDGRLDSWTWNDISELSDDKAERAGATKFTAGVAEFDLAHNDTRYIGKLPSGLYYKVEETAVDGFTTTSTGATGAIGSEDDLSTNAGAQASFTNTRDEGDLKVSKKLVSRRAADANTEFAFTVTLTDALGKTINGTYGDMTFKDGVASFGLKNGRSCTATDLPAGVAYTISETSVDGLVTTWDSNTSGTIAKDETAAVTATNTRETGGLRVSKDVVSDRATDHSDREFTFTVTLSDKSISGTFGEMKFENGVATFKLKDDQRVEARGLPTDVNYTVSETGATGFQITGMVLKDGDGDHENTNYGTIVETETSGTTVPEVVFENTRYTGALSVTKSVESERAADANKEFTFTIKLSDTSVGGSEGKTYTKLADDHLALTFKNGVATITLKDGQTASAGDLPVDVTYTVTEAETEGFTLTDKTGQTGVISPSGSTASFTNTRDTGDLEVEKVLTKINDDIKDYEYTFKVVLDDSTITGKYGDMTFAQNANNQAEATVKVKAGEKKVATGLPQQIQYKVTEVLTEEQAEKVQQLTGQNGVEGTIGSTVSKASITNMPIEGGLLLYKRVNSKTSADFNKDFTFRITLHKTGDDSSSSSSSSGDELHDTIVYDGVEFVDGVATVTLKHDQTKSITGIPAATQYTVEEVLSDDEAALYITNPEARKIEGTIEENKISSATFVNSRMGGGLTFSKEVVSDRVVDANQEFTFTATLKGDEGEGVNGTFGNTGEGLKTITFKNGVGTVKLKGGERVEIPADNGLPAGIEYTIVETSVSGFTTSVNGNTGNTATGTIAAGSSSTSVFTNTRETGNLQLTKEVVSPSAQDKSQDTTYAFVVKLSDTSISKNYGKVSESDALGLTFENGVANVQLSDGQVASAAGLPTGITYTITETNVTNTAHPDLALPVSNAFTVTSDNASGSITANATASAKYTNTRGTTEASVAKVWSDQDNEYAMRPQTLGVVLWIKGGGNKIDAEIDAKINGSAETQRVNISSEHGYAVTLTSGGDWQYAIANLPKYDYYGNLLEYEWSEENVPDGYTLTGPVTAGTLSTLTNTLDVGSVKIKKTFSGLPEGTDTSALEFKITKPDGTTQTLSYADFDENGEYVVAQNVPAGQKYQVVETNASKLVDKYTLLSTSVTSGDATVEKNATKTINLTNNYEQDLGSLRIHKTFSGLPEGTDTSRLAFEITYPDGTAKTVTYDKFSADGYYTVATDVPVDQTFEVRETNAEGLVANYTLLSTSTTTGNATVTKDTAIDIELTNNYKQDLGSVKIKKTFSGLPEGTDTSALEFKITKPDGTTQMVSYADFDENGEYVVAKDVPAGEEYRVEETNAASLVTNYTLLSTSTTAGSATVVKNETEVIELNNDYEQDLGSLTIRKTFTGLDEDADVSSLAFTITGPNNYEKTVTYAEFTDGKYTIAGLPVDNTYEVKETNAEGLVAGYTLVSTSVTEDSATIAEKGGVVYADLKNDYVEENKGRLQVIKEESGFLLTKAQKQAISFTVTGPKESDTPSEFTRTLADFDEVDDYNNPVWTLSGLEVGTYTVTETRSHGKWGKGDWSSVSTMSTLDGDVEVEKGEVATISAYNTYLTVNSVASLRVKKEVEATEDVPYTKDEDFSFMLSKAGCSVAADGETSVYSDALPNDTTITIKAGQTGEWDTIALSEAGTYYYLITEIIPETKTVGMTYADPIWAKIDATNIDSPVVYYGASKEEVDAKSGQGEDSGTVTNTYVLGSLTITKDVVINGEEPEDITSKEFKVTVQNAEGKYVSVNDGGTSLVDEPVELAVSEDAPLVIGGLPKGTYTVTETDTNRAIDLYTFEEGSSTTSGTAEIAKDLNGEVGLTNTYTQNTGEAAIKVAKQVTGDEYDGDEEFEFRLSAADGQADVPMPEETTVKVKAGADAVSFGTMTYTKPSTDYYYVVQEVAPATKTDGMTYDTAKKYIRVAVDDELNTTMYYADTQEALKDATASESPITVTVTNTYIPGSLTVTKDVVINGEEPEGVAGKEFKVTVQNAEGKYVSVNDGGTSLVDDPVELSVSEDARLTISGLLRGTYTVTETETNRAIDLYTFEEGSSTTTGTAEVAKDSDGEVDLTNTYTQNTGEASIKVAKQVTGDEYDGDEEFEFKLSAADGQTDVPMPENTTVKVKAGADAVSFGTMTYTKPSTDYYYVLQEVAPATKTDGMTYDTSERYIRVAVDDELNTTMYYADTEEALKDAATSESPLTVTVTNAYALPSKASVCLQATKVLKGRTLKESEFTFQLKNEDGEVLQTVTNAADGTITFADLTYTKSDVGTHAYTIVETVEDAKREANVTYDSTEYKAVVTVTYNAETNAVEATVAYPDGSPVFTNECSTSVALKATKVMEGRTLKSGEYSFKLRDADGELLQTKKNAADGTVTFDPIVYDSTAIGKTYEYAIGEVQGNEEYVTYDKHVAKVSVSVKLNDEGQAVAIPTYDEDAPATFTNVYSKQTTKKNTPTTTTTRSPSGSSGSSTSTRTTLSKTSDKTSYAPIVALLVAGCAAAGVGYVLKRKSKK